MSSMHEEADSIIVQQTVHIADNTFGCCGQHTYLHFLVFSMTKLLRTKQSSLACYGKSNCESLTKARHMMWTIKLVGVKLLHLLLCSFSQTNNSFRPNTLRVHLQMTIWLNYLESHPPDLD